MKIHRYIMLFCCAALLVGCYGGTSSEERAWEERKRSMEEELERVRKEAEAMDPEKIRQKEVRDSLCRELCLRVNRYLPKVASVDSVLEAGADPNCGCAVVHSSKRFGARIPIVKDFMKRKYNTWESMEGVLEVAVGKGDSEIVGALVEAGADVNGTDSSRGMPLNKALASGDKKITDQLLKLGADAKFADLGFAKTEKEVDRFIKLGADPKNINFNPAIRNCNERLIRKYFKLGGEPKKVDHFFLLNFCDRKGLLKVMLDLGMDPEVSDRMGRGTLLVEALETGETYQVEQLLKAGADPNHRDERDRSPLQVAVENGNPKEVQSLLDHGAEVNPPLGDRIFSKNVMEVAIKSGNVEVVKILAEKGGKVGKGRGGNLNFAKEKGASEEVLEVLK